MNIKQKISLFARGKCFLCADDVVCYDALGFINWAVPDYDAKGKKTKYFQTLAFYKKPDSPCNAYAVTFFHCGKQARSRLMELGKVYGFTVTSNGYFIAAKRLRVPGLGIVKKGDVIGKSVGRIVLGGKA
jgi:hypothetical protein